MRARPQVSYTVDARPEEVFAWFREALAEDGCPCAGWVGRQEVTLHVAVSHRRLWSPWLLLGVRGDGEQTVVSGTMGPQPNLWTAYVFVYSVLVAGCVAGGMYGAVQASLGQPPTGWTAALSAGCGLGLACTLDLLGRRRGEGQMGILRGFVERVTGDGGGRRGGEPPTLTPAR
ncbi:MAG: hypothetical protein R3F61_14640 [Myxococcota bacterium]